MPGDQIIYGGCSGCGNNLYRNSDDEPWICNICGVPREPTLAAVAKLPKPIHETLLDVAEQAGMLDPPTKTQEKSNGREEKKET
jgi:hypothetical protein